MKTLRTTLKNTLPVDFNTPHPGDILFFDIETTGLTPDLSTIFMIGCGFFNGDRLEITQWLSDSPELHGELEILRAFSEWLENHKTISGKWHLITYNGQNFDLPFLQSRCDQCGISNPLAAMQLTENHRDFYRFLRNFKNLWPVPNLKLKSIAAWLGYAPSGAPEGRKLILAYQEYVKTKESSILDLLFLHNIQDLSALGFILSLCNYAAFFNGAYTVTKTALSEKDGLEFVITPNVYLPKPLNYEAFGFRMAVSPSEVHILAPVYDGKLRYYHSDFKNYVYLPKEDYAIPKSMASYIDRNHWIKTSRENCYTWFPLDDGFANDIDGQKQYTSMIFRLFGFSGQKTFKK